MDDLYRSGVDIGDFLNGGGSGGGGDDDDDDYGDDNDEDDDGDDDDEDDEDDEDDDDDIHIPTPEERRQNYNLVAQPVSTKYMVQSAFKQIIDYINSMPAKPGTGGGKRPPGVLIASNSLTAGLDVLALGDTQNRIFYIENPDIPEERPIETVGPTDEQVEILWDFLPQGKLLKVFKFGKSLNKTYKTIDNILPNQGTVKGKVKGAPPVDAGKQGKHVPGHNNNVPSKSQWPVGQDGVEQTQEAWIKGTSYPNRPEVKIYDYGYPVGPNGETRVKVHIDSSGNIHGYPIP